MNHFTMALWSIVATGLMLAPLLVRGEQSDAASCEQSDVVGQCRIFWNFARGENAHYWVQQFDGNQAAWRTVAKLPVGSSSSGSQSMSAEPGYLYRVWACDDAEALSNCSGSTIVWAPFIQPENQVYLIPSRVHLIGSEARFGKPTDGIIMKDADWLTQVIQYNVYQLDNALANSDMAAMPDMTPVADSREVPPESLQPADQVQSNIYSVYLARQGRRASSPTPAQESLRPHEHPERHPQ